MKKYAIIISVFLINILMIAGAEIPDIKDNSMIDCDSLETSVSKIEIISLNGHYLLKFKLNLHNKGNKIVKLNGMELFHNQIIESCLTFTTIRGKINVDSRSGNAYTSKSQFITLSPKSKISFGIRVRIVSAKRGNVTLAVQSMYNKELFAIFNVFISKDISDHKITMKGKLWEMQDFFCKLPLIFFAVDNNGDNY